MNPAPEQPDLDDSKMENNDQPADAASNNQSTDASASEPVEAVNEVQQLQAKLAEAEKQFLVARAELENYRKRSARDYQDQLKYASLNLMGDILGVADNLHRAIDSAENEANATGLLAGVKMVTEQIQQVLDSHGCKRIEAVGTDFDPNHHEALQMQPSEEYSANTVMLEVRPGFRLHDRVIRPSQVFVSTGPAPQ